MLREHFRCVPPIIAYSNGFYDGFIQPLRIPKASERLDPPLVDIYVPSGVRTSRDINRQEAQAIADEIEAIVSNPTVRRQDAGCGFTAGTGPGAVHRHRRPIPGGRDGTPAAPVRVRRRPVFQGSERDIMFLSMVVDPSNSRALSGNMFEQRFNVAASRARDRMYLVRSVQLADLSHADLRRGLLAALRQAPGWFGRRGAKPHRPMRVRIRAGRLPEPRTAAAIELSRRFGPDRSGSTSWSKARTTPDWRSSAMGMISTGPTAGLPT
jgi:hypothetical protein